MKAPFIASTFGLGQYTQHVVLDANYGLVETVATAQGAKELAERLNTRTAVRELEKHVQSMTGDRAEQIAIISKAQSLTLENEYNLAVMAIAKNRIIHSKV